MLVSPTIAAVRRFLSLVLEGMPPTDAALARALDELALAYHDTPDGEPEEEDATPPKTDYPQRYAELSARFPHYGHYPVADPLETEGQQYMLGDAIDDLADIVGDLQEIVWRFERLGADDAHWHFRFLYLAHWGGHLRELSLYLHARVRRDTVAG